MILLKLDNIFFPSIIAYTNITHQIHNKNKKSITNKNNVALDRR